MELKGGWNLVSSCNGEPQAGQSGHTIEAVQFNVHQCLVDLVDFCYKPFN